ncbi:MAG: FAD-binding oxidoreductase [candidate division WOR-3 bacterium]
MQKLFHFAPSSAAEAAKLFAVCTDLRKSGRRIKVGILESQFEPGRGLDLPAASKSLSEIEAICNDEEVLVITGHSAMDRIEEISRSDLLAVVGGGVEFGRFFDTISKEGFFFPHEPDERTSSLTIAGLLMANVRFPTDASFGRLREYILALELALPRGEVIHVGSRAVKDVTAYDIAGFVLGAGGRCGMIARATIRLLPLPLVPIERGSVPETSVTGDARMSEELEKISERLYGVFDPAGIMLP